MQKPISPLMSLIVRWVVFFKAMWVPSLIGLTAVYLLAETQEMHEIYRALIEEAASHPGPILIGLFSIVLLSRCLYTAAKRFADSYLAGPSEPPVMGPYGTAVFCLSLSLSPWIGVAIGTWHAHLHSAPGIDDKTLLILSWITRLSVSAVSAVFVVYCLMVRKGGAGISGSQHSWGWLTLGPLGGLVILVAASVVCSQVFGPIAIVTLFLATLTIALTFGIEVYRKYQIPVIPAFICAFALFSFFDLNDNHRLRTRSTGKEEDGAQREFQSFIESRLKETGHFTADDLFSTWLSNRKDLDAYQQSKKPYPVYVIAAQGGGIYAAYHAAAFLAAMQDRCPSFAQHIFAISSVSGGSMGAAVFAGLVSSHGRNTSSEPCTLDETLPNPVFSQQVDSVLQADFLSPVLAGALFPDFIQQFLPIPIPSLDRARRLERSLENAWVDTSLGTAGFYAPWHFPSLDCQGSGAGASL
jgi:hypothetical protein